MKRSTSKPTHLRVATSSNLEVRVPSREELLPIPGDDYEGSLSLSRMLKRLKARQDAKAAKDKNRK